HDAEEARDAVNRDAGPLRRVSPGEGADVADPARPREEGPGGDQGQVAAKRRTRDGFGYGRQFSGVTSAAPCLASQARSICSGRASRADTEPGRSARAG